VIADLGTLLIALYVEPTDRIIPCWALPGPVRASGGALPGTRLAHLAGNVRPIRNCLAELGGVQADQVAVFTERLLVLHRVDNARWPRSGPR
jgi:hypothetical protein